MPTLPRPRRPARKAQDPGRRTKDPAPRTPDRGARTPDPGPRTQDLGPSISLARPIRQSLIAHARRERPLECCGLLVGRGRTVLCAVAMTNVERSAVRYRLDDRAHIDLRRVLRTTMPALSIVGVYHSHPSSRPYPSPSDVAGAHYPEWIHVIIGFRGESARIRAFTLRTGRIHPVRIR